MIDPRFSAAAFREEGAVEQLTQELETMLTARLRFAAQPEQEAYAMVEDLRQLGHDLWSFDASDEMQTWCGNWTEPEKDPRVFIDFTYREGMPPEVSITVKRRLSTR
ncbi:hypothetical protein [Corallococcus terminator]|uniref:Uncharacterized protein n=1 Tax=Corallococcus terminator TaxID=2316733 RepID=A0A3A8IGE2_9BACT|nr:hypothetical protein [Corallococcus terminator]RKG82462.1 hypothetical protein D7V88_25240 [Corallococcus terminator]